MDISVSQLNNRLALQLPTELPLGLVFVAGHLQDVFYEAAENGRGAWATFELEQDGYSLRCRLNFRPEEEIELEDGAQVRLGGHLTFDAQRAQYFLLARDVELLSETNGVSEAALSGLSGVINDEEALISALATVKRRSQVVQQTSDLPIWVQKLAPKEVQETLADDVLEDVQSERVEQTKPELNEEMVAYLSSAMDSEEDVELTPELLAKLLPEDSPSLQLNGDAVVPDEPTAVSDDEAVLTELQAWSDSLEDVEDDGETAVRPYDPVDSEHAAPEAVVNKPSRQPAAQQGTDWPVLILIGVLIVIAVLLVIAIVNLAF